MYEYWHLNLKCRSYVKKIYLSLTATILMSVFKFSIQGQVVCKNNIISKISFIATRFKKKIIKYLFRHKKNYNRKFSMKFVVFLTIIIEFRLGPLFQTNIYMHVCCTDYIKKKYHAKSLKNCGANEIYK